MDFNQIRDLIHMFNESTMSKLEIEGKDIKIKLEKEVTIKEEKLHEINEIKQPIVAMNNQQQEKQTKQEYLEIKSPIVGVYYEKATPETKPFVEEGMIVEKGQVLCIVEAMKVMNEIVATSRGKVIKKVVANEDFVEYDQVLLFIEEGV